MIKARISADRGSARSRIRKEIIHADRRSLIWQKVADEI